jgi:hypothetical protein
LKPLKKKEHYEKQSKGAQKDKLLLKFLPLQAGCKNYQLHYG